MERRSEVRESVCPLCRREAVQETMTTLAEDQSSTMRSVTLPS